MINVVKYDYNRLSIFKLSCVFVFFICVNNYFSFIITNVLPIPYFRYIMVICAFIALGLLFLNNNGKINIWFRREWNYTVIGLFLCLVSAPFWYSCYNAYSYIGISIAFLVINTNTHYFAFLLKKIFYLCFVLSMYEFIVKQYVFEPVYQFANENIIVTPELMGGATGVFRAKAIFLEPLNFGQFIVGVVLINYKNIYITILGILMCFFANFRSGVIILAILLLVRIFIRLRLSIKHFFYIIIIGIVLLMVAKYVIPRFSEDASVSRLVDTFNMESSGNVMRVYYMISGLIEFSQYSIAHLLVGNNGYFVSKYFNNPESGWICLLTDNGILGFIYYLVPIVYLAGYFFRNKMILEMTVVFLIAAMMVGMTYHLTISNLTYWICIFMLSIRARSIDLYEKNFCNTQGGL